MLTDDDYDDERVILYRTDFFFGRMKIMIGTKVGIFFYFTF